MPPQFLSIKNFEKYQHYKKRNPPWIKLYYELLDDDDFISMSITSRHHYMTLLLVAGRKNNRIPNDTKYLRKVMRLDDAPDLIELFDSGFLLASRKQSASSTKTPCKQNALSETEYSEAETKTELRGVNEFEAFWVQYPRKVGKKAALSAWKKAADRPGLPEMLFALDQAKRSEQWTKDNGRFIPHPSTWLNQGRWADQPTTSASSPCQARIQDGRFLRSCGKPSITGKANTARCELHPVPIKPLPPRTPHHGG